MATALRCGAAVVNLGRTELAHSITARRCTIPWVTPAGSHQAEPEMVARMETFAPPGNAVNHFETRNGNSQRPEMLRWHSRDTELLVTECPANIKMLHCVARKGSDVRSILAKIT